MKIGSLVNTYKVKARKLLPPIGNPMTNVRECLSEMKTNYRTGLDIGNRLNLLEGNSNPVKKRYVCARGVIRKFKFRRQDVPGVLGIIGLGLPIPGAAVTGFVIGKVITNDYVVKAVKYVARRFV